MPEFKSHWFAAVEDSTGKYNWEDGAWDFNEAKAIAQQKNRKYVAEIDLENKEVINVTTI